MVFDRKPHQREILRLSITVATSWNPPGSSSILLIVGANIALSDLMQSPEIELDPEYIYEKTAELLLPTPDSSGKVRGNLQERRGEWCVSGPYQIRHGSRYRARALPTGF